MSRRSNRYESRTRGRYDLWATLSLQVTPTKRSKVLNREEVGWAVSGERLGRGEGGVCREDG